MLLRHGTDNVWDAVRLGVLTSADLDARGKIDALSALSPIKRLPYQIQEPAHADAPPPPPPTQKARGKGSGDVALKVICRELQEAEKENLALHKTVARQNKLISGFCDFVQTMR